MKNLQPLFVLLFLLTSLVSCQKELSFTSGIPGIKIFEKTWMQKNLDVVTYSNGDIIPQVTDNATWNSLTTGAWCYYDNDTANAKYGKLYNWYAVNDPRGLAPDGWHIPSKEEYIALVDSLGGDVVAGGKMKATVLWNSPNTGATNESGFTGLPGGLRSGGGVCTSMGIAGYWWTTKEHDATTAVERSLNYDITDCYMYFLEKTWGMSVRCVKNKN
ncbi:MAG: fibrobacter succinogenes major paralogous domain-containing protein [Ferruginibacter sp.]